MANVIKTAMNERDLQEEKLKTLESALLRAGKISDAEIEKIVAAPQLFERVAASIKEESRRKTKVKNVFAPPIFQFWNWQKSVLAFALVGFLVVCTAMIFVRFSGSPETARKLTIEEKQFSVSEAVKQAEIVSPQTFEIQKNEFLSHKIALTKKAKTKNNLPASQKYARTKRHLPQKFETQPEEPFIALTYAGNLANEESHIVRVEMTPARLLALGVGVQTENESEKIKTDLLVSSDGVARAFRVVK